MLFTVKLCTGVTLDFFSSFGVVKGEFLVQGSDDGGTFCLHFWNLHRIWI